MDNLLNITVCSIIVKIRSFAPTEDFDITQRSSLLYLVSRFTPCELVQTLFVF